MSPAVYCADKEIEKSVAMITHVLRHWFEQRQFASKAKIDTSRWEVAQKKGTALSLVFVDIEPEQDANFNAWYNEEHVPDLLKLYRAPWSI